MAGILDTIAARAGVSRRTVANVLSGDYAPRQKQAVLRAAEIRRIADELRYRPNAAARAARTGRFQAAGLLMCGGSPAFLPMGFVDTLTQTLADRQHRLILEHLNLPTPVDPMPTPRILQEHCVDGLLVERTQNLPGYLREDEHRLGPMISLNHKGDANCVHPDDLDGARRVTEHLLELGHRRIAYIARHRARADWRSEGKLRHEVWGRGTTSAGHYSEVERFQGYRQAMMSAGLPAQQLEYGDVLTPPQVIGALAAQLIGGDAPTAVVCESELAAEHVYAASLTVGRSVPGDLSVATFSWGGTQRVQYGFTCGLVPMLNYTTMAVDLLMARIAEPEVDQPAHAIPMLLLVGETTGRCDR